MGSDRDAAHARYRITSGGSCSIDVLCSRRRRAVAAGPSTSFARNVSRLASGSENPPGPSNNPGTVATFLGERRRTESSVVEPTHSHGSGVLVDVGSQNAER
jgi:hypothetical protein